MTVTAFLIFPLTTVFLFINLRSNLSGNQKYAELNDSQFREVKVKTGAAVLTCFIDFFHTEMWLVQSSLEKEISSISACRPARKTTEKTM